MGRPLKVCKQISNIIQDMLVRSLRLLGGELTRMQQKYFQGDMLGRYCNGSKKEMMMLVTYNGMRV
jgi:hypothetical protein